MSLTPDRTVPAIPAVDPVVALLADDTTRAIIVLLGEEQARSGPIAVSEAPLPGSSPRLIKDRLRALRRRGIVEPAEVTRDVAGAPARWSLTAAGLDLYRVQTLMTRVAVRAAGLGDQATPRARDVALGATLEALSDPVVLAIADALAHSDGPMSPEALQTRCSSVSRRTLYRRLSLLVDQGAVTRTHSRSVPRTTTYAFVQRWRPVAAIPLLAAWWAQRHGDARSPGSLFPAAVSGQPDLDRLVALVLPLVSQKPRGPVGSRTSWSVTGPGAGVPVVLVATPEGLALSAVTDGAEARAEGAADAWVAALVADQTDGLSFGGNLALARDTVHAVRAALLAYVR